MKISDKNSFIVSTVIFALLTILYAFCIRVGISKQNINLIKCDKLKSVVQNRGLDFRIDSKGKKTKVFFIKLVDLDKKIGVYRMSNVYDDLINQIGKGDTLNVYYMKNSNESENINIDLIQIEKHGKIILDKKEYEKKESSLIFIGAGAILGNIILWFYSRKRYLEKAKNSISSL
ncbi:MAG TPA: hypothetical protein PK431_16000 [Chitinophagales bacterium]|nr:hypothetical protein [Chitinophagales bacterium]